jgi:hypothetical protein
MLSDASKSALQNVSKKIDRLRTEVIAELETAKVRATKNGRLNEALAIKDAMEKLSSTLNYSFASNSPWNSGSIAKPFGGNVETKANGLVLWGSGSGPVQNVTAIFPKPLAVGEKIKGELIVSSDWCGFALGASRSGREFHAFYTNAGKSVLWKHVGKDRSEVAVDIPVAIPVSEKVPFSLFRPEENKTVVTIGDSSYTFLDESRQGYWGLTTYAGGRIEITIE